MKRRRFTKEFKQEIVEMSYSTDKSLDQFAQDMGVGRSTLNTWRNQAKALGQNAFPGSGHQTPDHAELSRLKR